MAARHARQGDVLIREADFTPNETATKVKRDSGRVILAYGEVTGHAHAITSPHASLWERGDDKFLVVDEAVEVKHEEHDTIPLEAGSYQITIQREYSPEGIHNVLD